MHADNALRPMSLRSSWAGSDAQHMKFTTSFAIWDFVHGVPS
eukprot:CAMPEP_0176242100 /NCGR_PEP_ID=MMETSP0121_2-20121125/30234_1 /TAXON_ID=160619 /ORGANISM="Kryptoperidinium foliaceum, Strain CCMP 1326" /LENGTH=41 /DNA_ID= /DNA_START= /DNA_END= /DNA_ORIENTATION=